MCPFVGKTKDMTWVDNNNVQGVPCRQRSRSSVGMLIRRSTLRRLLPLYAGVE